MSAPECRAAHVAGEPRSESGLFRRLSQGVTELTGSPVAAVIVVAAALVWLGVGVLTNYPRWWELIVSAGVPFLTLLMLVVLQYTQNHDARATQLKLDELIRANERATNRMMTVEDASPEDLERIRDNFRQQAEAPSHE